MAMGKNGQHWLQQYKKMYQLVCQLTIVQIKHFLKILFQPLQFFFIQMSIKEF